MAKRKDGKPRSVINMTDHDRKVLRDIGRKYSDEKLRKQYRGGVTYANHDETLEKAREIVANNSELMKRLGEN